MGIEEIVNIEDKSYRVLWHGKDFEPPRRQVTQTSGICFTVHSNIVLVRGSMGEWMLPGGHPIGDETLQASLKREVREEACAEVTEQNYIGCQEVHVLSDDGTASDTHFACRFWARVKLSEFVPLFETVERICVEPEEFIMTLNWATKKCAEAILEAGLLEEQRKT